MESEKNKSCDDQKCGGREETNAMIHGTSPVEAGFGAELQYNASFIQNELLVDRQLRMHLHSVGCCELVVCGGFDCGEHLLQMVAGKIAAVRDDGRYFLRVGISSSGFALRSTRSASLSFSTVPS